MEILFRQGKNADNVAFSLLESYGIEGCIFKQIAFARDRARVTKKSHYHTSIEIHIIERGYQVYEVGGEAVRVTAGEFLILPPAIPHIALDEDPETEKLAFGFRLREEAPFALPSSVLHGVLPARVWESISVIKEEGRFRAPFHTTVAESRVWECLLEIFRTVKVIKRAASSPPDNDENGHLLLAKQYIQDNVRRPVTLSELASYACIGEKQLERIFRRETGMTVMGYIRKERCRAIEALLADPALSLREISEIMNFGSEYHFNAFFKRYAGMPPGAYRKAVMK